MNEDNSTDITNIESFDFNSMLSSVNSIFRTFESVTGMPLESLDNSTSNTSIEDVFKNIFSVAKDIIESDKKKKSVTENETDMIADEAGDWGYEYILEHYDRYKLQEDGSYVYQQVSDEVYQHIKDSIVEQYDFSDGEWDMMYDALADIVYERVNFEHIWEAIDEILNASTNMEEKLAEVGMSISDFI